MGSRGGASGKSSGKSSGGGANNASQTKSWEDVMFEEPVLSPLKPTKAAEKEFRTSYRQARGISESGMGTDNWVLQTFRDDTNPDFTKEYSVQTLRGIQQQINFEKSHIKHSVKFGVITPEQALTRTEALAAMQRTLNNTIKRQREIKKGLK